MRRREFIAGLGGAAAWPLAARAQKRPIPLIGFLNGGTPSTYANRVAAFHSGLKEAGFVEGRNVLIEYRWAGGQFDRLQGLVIELIGLRPTVMVLNPSSAALAAKAATTTIPIVYVGGGDAVDLGLVDSLNRPGGNVTGVSALVNALVPKRLQMLRALAPRASHIAMLINPGDPTAASVSGPATEAASMLGVQIDLWKARTEAELDVAFATQAHQTDALLVPPDPLFVTLRDQIIALAQRHSMPAMYPYSEDVRAGGLISYGPSLYIPQIGAPCWSYSQRRKGGQPAGRAADKIRIGHQPENRQGARPHHPGDAVGHRR
jgi:putative tryptophan/tyrosine transport system substrate-binding protein